MGFWVTRMCYCTIFHLLHSASFAWHIYYLKYRMVSSHIFFSFQYLSSHKYSLPSHFMAFHCHDMSLVPLLLSVLSSSYLQPCCYQVRYLLWWSHLQSCAAFLCCFGLFYTFNWITAFTSIRLWQFRMVDGFHLLYPSPCYS